MTKKIDESDGAPSTAERLSSSNMGAAETSQKIVELLMKGTELTEEELAFIDQVGFTRDQLSEMRLSLKEADSETQKATRVRIERSMLIKLLTPFDIDKILPIHPLRSRNFSKPE